MKTATNIFRLHGRVSREHLQSVGHVAGMLPRLARGANCEGHFHQYTLVDADLSATSAPRVSARMPMSQGMEELSTSSGPPSSPNSRWHPQVYGRRACFS